MSGSRIHWVAVLTIHEGMLDEFRRRAADMIGLCEATEPGQLAYEWHLSPDGRTCHVDEWYADVDAAWAHVRGEALATKLPPLLETCEFSALWIYSQVPDDELRQALVGFGATFWDNWAGRTQAVAA